MKHWENLIELLKILQLSSTKNKNGKKIEKYRKYTVKKNNWIEKLLIYVHTFSALDSPQNPQLKYTR